MGFDNLSWRMRRRGSLCGEWAVAIESVWQRPGRKSWLCLEWKSCRAPEQVTGERGWQPGSERPSVLTGEGVQAGLQKWLGAESLGLCPAAAVCLWGQVGLGRATGLVVPRPWDWGLEQRWQVAWRWAEAFGGVPGPL